MLIEKTIQKRYRDLIHNNLFLSLKKSVISDTLRRSEKLLPYFTLNGFFRYFLMTIFNILNITLKT